MLSRLSHRLKKLEGRFAPPVEQKRRRFLFVEGNGEVTATLSIGNGESTWWYAPGHGLNDSRPEGKGTRHRETAR